MTIHHVNAAQSVSGDGSSWEAAWKSFSAIDWSRILPGDTILIAGGLYKESLRVAASGSAGAPITITAATEAGRNGPVVIDGENLREAGVLIAGHDHLTISALSLVNHAGAALRVRHSHAGVVLENNDILSGDPGGGNARGIDIRQSAGVVVRNNNIATPDSTPAQTDGIWSSDNHDLLIEGNRIVISNHDSTGHSDGIQSFQDYQLTIRNNWIEQANSATEHNHGLWLVNTRAGGLITVHNNVILAPNLTGDSVVTHWHDAGWSEFGRAEFSENTIIGGARTLNLVNTPFASATANILVPARDGSAVSIGGEGIAAAGIQDNLIWAPGGRVATVSDRAKGWADWQAIGYDLSGLYAAPVFLQDYGQPAPLPAGTRGADLTGIAVGSQAASSARTMSAEEGGDGFVPPVVPAPGDTAVGPPLFIGTAGDEAGLSPVSLVGATFQPADYLFP